MTIQPGRTYRHEKCLDVVMIPWSVLTKPNGDVKINCAWHNEDSKELLAYDKIEIKKEDLDKWKKL